MQGKEGFAFAGEGEIGVVLDTHMTEELLEEGFVREILSKIQNMRKDKGFEVMDNIILYVYDNQKLLDIIEKNKESIMKDTLAKEIVYNNKEIEYIDVKINGENLKLNLAKI